MQGYKTIVTNAIVLIAGIMAMQGIVIPESDQTAFALGITAAVNIVLRVMTKTPVGQNEKDTIKLAKQYGVIKRP